MEIEQREIVWPPVSEVRTRSKNIICVPIVIGTW